MTAASHAICLFGGTFDPVHEGHIHIAHAAHDACAFDELIIIPCQQSPHKSTATRASGEQRAEMLRLATRDLNWIHIDELELHRPSPSYSWQTVETFSRSHPKSTLYWLLGTDQWNALHRWAAYDFLVEKLHFIIFTRGEDTLAERPGAAHTVISGAHPASSTQIRKALAEQTPAPWLHTDVSTFVRENGIYRHP